jgi:hypothetical protein
MFSTLGKGGSEGFLANATAQKKGLGQAHNSTTSKGWLDVKAQYVVSGVHSD